MKTILQSEASECGLACLAMIASSFGYQTDMRALRQRFAISIKGATLTHLIRYAAGMQMTARPLKLECDELAMLKLPCMLHWDMRHFVVLKEIRKSVTGKTTFVLIDPAVGRRQLTEAEMSLHFTGVALELAPTEEFVPEDKVARLPLKAVIGTVVGLRRAVLQIVGMALALEIFAIASPLFNQFVTDEVIAGGDRDLLKVLLIGFSLMAITQMAISVARGWVLMRWSLDIGLQWSIRVFSHLTRLPVSFFEKRHIGDIVSRFSSIGAIQKTLTIIFVDSALDGLMAILALAMMLLYSPTMTAIVATELLLYGLLRWAFYQPLRDASQERLLLAAKESSHFLETLRAITALKLFGQEAERRAHWMNLTQDVINRDVATQKLGILFKTSSGAIATAQGLAIFFVGAGLVMDSKLTLGMLLAFSSYSSTFSGRVMNMIDQFINFKMLSLHIERLSDIVLEKPEEDTMFETDVSRIQSAITLKDVRFRYADGEPWVLDRVNLHIPAGQSIALVGPSGCGKTTLCKIILGLIEPTEGEVLIDNIPVKQLGFRTYRDLVGTVMQDDALLAGSIQDNITFFKDKADIESVFECARMAAIHEEICAMPMGYQTLVGDMGSSLSGGQKQRILLARALYKKPKVLALDEATSHLDVNNESRVNDALSRLQLTRILVAHRPETINSAERVVALVDGKAVEVRGVNQTELEQAA